MQTEIGGSFLLSSSAWTELVAGGRYDGEEGGGFVSLGWWVEARRRGGAGWFVFCDAMM